MSQFEEQKQEDERIESTENLVNVSLEAVAANRESLEATDDAPDDAAEFMAEMRAKAEREEET